MHKVISEGFGRAASRGTHETSRVVSCQVIVDNPAITGFAFTDSVADDVILVGVTLEVTHQSEVPDNPPYTVFWTLRIGESTPTSLNELRRWDDLFPTFAAGVKVIPRAYGLYVSRSWNLRREILGPSRRFGIDVVVATGVQVIILASFQIIES